LEQDGVLRSWAAPRGLPTSSAVKRLAVAVPDLDHLNNQDDDKTVADTGRWEEHDRNDRRIVLTLHGRSGARWHALIPTGLWLLHLTNDQPG
jgi:hypothetical protein